MSLATLKSTTVTGTGIREIADLNDIDTALAKLIADSFDNVSLPDTRTATKGLRAFLRKPAKERITIGDFDDISEYLKEKQAHSNHATSTRTDKNPLALPALHIGRTLDYSFYVGDYSKLNQNVGNVRDPAGKVVAALRVTPVQLSYKLWLVADTRAELSWISALLGDWLRFRADLSSIDFAAASVLAGANVEMPCHIDGSKNVMFSNVSLPVTENKVYALELQISVIADLMTADFASVVTTKIEMSNEVLYGNNS